MHDIKSIRENPTAFDAGMARRNLPAQSSQILAIDAEQRQGMNQLQQLQQRSNQLAKDIGALMATGKKAEAAPLLEESKQVKAQIAALKDGDANDESSAVRDILLGIPNLLLPEVPEGKDESQNVELRRWGTPSTNATPLHDDIGAALGLMDSTYTALISGSRFTTLSGGLAKLERALAAFMLEMHTTTHGYTEVSTPLLVRADAMVGTSQLPKFEADLFKTTDGRYLIPTAEVSVTNLVRERILDEAQLPIRLTACTPCFRSEAGAAGRDTRGMIRQHQFTKVELVTITTPDQAEAEHTRMTGCAEAILQALNLPYRVVMLCAGDTGFASRKTYDIEVWLPGQQAYREISSCSQFGDFQARRMQTRYRNKAGTVQHVHTLNGSALAVGRTLVAVLENYHQPDGSVLIPEALRPYMGGLERISPQPNPLG